MANTSSAKKRNRQIITRRLHNMSLRSRARTSIKKVLASLASKDLTKAQENFKSAQSILDKMVSVGIYHRNKVARHKSRLNAKIKDLAISKA